MNIYSKLNIDGYEEVVRCNNNSVGFTAWIAVHNSNRGPALGGCRVWNYDSEEEALKDVLRLSKGMTYKNALAKLPLGGGKSVVFTDLKTVDKTLLFEAVGDFVERLSGRYITAEDVNSTIEDMKIVKKRTDYVATVGASGNPSPFTAYGVYCAIRAAVRYRLDKKTLKGLTVVIQGAGETGSRLAEMLYRDGCKIKVTDINQDNLKTLAKRVDFIELPPEKIFSEECDIFAPCALGGILNKITIPSLHCSIVCGSANNQLLVPEDGVRLFNRGILYAPDYVANAGGVINISCEIGRSYDPKRARKFTARIGRTLFDILGEAKRQEQPPFIIADSMAEELFKMRNAA